MNTKHVAVILLVILTIGFIIMPCSCILLGENPPKPEVTYGEFPFRLEYKINGELVIIEDVVICEFDGFGWNEMRGKYRKWTSHLSNSKKESAVLIIVDEKVKIYCYVGSAEYYMGDEKWPELRPLTPRFVPIKNNPNDMNVYQIDEFIEKYGLKLISWEFTDPIVNTFK